MKKGMLLMKGIREIALLLGIILSAEGIPQVSASSQEIPRITKEELKNKLDNPDVIVIDVRTDKDWGDSTLKIKGAVREDPENVISSMDRYPKKKTLVFYCA